MRVWLDPEKMASLGITPLDVRNALAANNFTTAAGEVKSDFTQQNINAQTSLETPEQLLLKYHRLQGSAPGATASASPSSWPPPMPTRAAC